MKAGSVTGAMENKLEAEIISVGTELLLGDTVDTNAAYLSRILSELGIDLRRRVTVGDNFERIRQAIVESLSRADLAVTIGGLGPTEDDITKEAAAAAIGVELLPDEESAENIRRFFARRGVSLPERNLKQAVRPAEGFAIPNTAGTAPGAVFEKGGKVVICLPGPPGEFKTMVEQGVRPYLESARGPTSGTIVSRVLRLCGIGESAVEELIRDLLHTDNPTVAPLAHLGEVHLRITAKAAGRNEAEGLIADAESGLRDRIGEYVYGVDSETLEAAVLALLKTRGLSLGLAESCSGGLISNRITNVPGSSAVYMGGVVSYSNDVKTKLLGVSEYLLREYGAVSSQVAEAMAVGVRQAVHADVGLATTGIAGPTGGTAEKPVGLVYVGLSVAGQEPVSREHHFAGPRTDVKQRASTAALTMLWERLRR